MINIACDHNGRHLFATSLGNQEKAIKAYQDLTGVKVDFCFPHEIKGSETGDLWIVVDSEFCIRFLYRGSIEDAVEFTRDYTNKYSTPGATYTTLFGATIFYKLFPGKSWHLSICPFLEIK